MADRCFYFGCWQEAGHYLFCADGGRPTHAETRTICEFDGAFQVDGGLAPQVNSRTREITCSWLSPKRDAIGRWNSISECPLGQFLLHQLPNGFTAISWWDYTQGDQRPNSNSTILLEGAHSADEMLAAAREHFPHVLENLARAGVELVQVQVGDGREGA